jgi:hypothetical protein
MEKEKKKEKKEKKEKLEDSNLSFELTTEEEYPHLTQFIRDHEKLERNEEKCITFSLCLPARKLILNF